MPAPHPGRVLVGERQLRTRIAELGAEIAPRYAKEPPVLVGVLQGAFLFMADLVRAMPIDLQTDFVRVESYGSGTTSTGRVRLAQDLATPIEGRDVLVIEDVVDTGLTLAALRRVLEARQPRSLRVCALCDKTERRRVDVEADWVGFTLPDVFVVGYGLDYCGLYRNLPDVVALEHI